MAPGNKIFALSVAIEIADSGWLESAQGSPFPFRTLDEVQAIRVNHAKLRTFAAHIVTEMQPHETTSANLAQSMGVRIVMEKYSPGGLNCLGPKARHLRQ
jgi:hypothetical protein